MEHIRDNCNDMNKFKTEETDNSVIVPNSSTTVYDKSQSLVDIANNTFKELCRTLENEQFKLLELEERRKKLQEEMQRLKLEIEEEKHTYRLNLVESLTENADLMCAKDLASLESDKDEETADENCTDLKHSFYIYCETEDPAIGEDSDKVTDLSGANNNINPPMTLRVPWKENFRK